MKNHDGRPGVLRVLTHLREAAAECDRRVRLGEAPGASEIGALKRLGARARKAAEALQAADDRKQFALAEVKRGDLDLARSYDDASNGLREVAAGLFSLYGMQPSELAAFGVQSPYRKGGTKRKRAETGPAGPPADEPAPTAGATAATAAAGAAMEVSHHG